MAKFSKPIKNGTLKDKDLESQSGLRRPNQTFKISWLQGLRPVNRASLGQDVIAGIVLAALGIPEVMGYSKISGTPVVTGLYTLLLPALAFALFCSSRHLVVAADSATAAILAAGLAKLNLSSSEEYLALASLTALLTAGLLLLAWLFRLGFLADFLSRTVLIGFLTGVGLQVAIAQIPDLLGLTSSQPGPLGSIGVLLEPFSKINLPTLAIALSILIVILLLEKVLPKFPGALVAVVGAIAVSWAFNLARYGVAIVGPIPSGLPKLGLPMSVAELASNPHLPALFPIALSCCIVIIAQSAATSRAYAFRYNEPFHENVDIVGLAMANLAAGFSGTFVVNGSPTKTAIVDTAGGRSQVAQLTTVGITLGVLLFLTQPIRYLPNAALAAIVFLIGTKLIDLKGLVNVFRTHRGEFYLAIATAVTVIFVGVKEGIILAVLLSLLLHVRHSYRPHSAVIVPGSHRLWSQLPVQPGTVTASGLIVYRFSRDLFYANVTRFAEEIQMLVKTAPSPVHCVILEARAITEIDYSAYKTLQDLVKTLNQQQVILLVSGLEPTVKTQFDRDGLTDLVGTHRFYNHLEAALEAFSGLQPTE